jgi:Zn-dependent membrane protease YugP
LPGDSEPCVVTPTFLNNSTTKDIKIEKYVLLAGILVETSQLVTVMIVVLSAAVILCLEVFRRKRHSSRKDES